MNIHLYLLTLFIGVILSLHLGMNSQVGEIIGNPEMGNFFFWFIGAVSAFLIGLSAWDTTVFQQLGEVPLWLWTAGVMGAALVFGIAWLIPQIGAGVTFIIMLSGQVIAGMILSHFGVLGSPVEPINWVQVLGVMVMITGAGIVTFN